MATKVVTGKVTAPDGTGKAGVVVRASLSQGAVVSGTSEVPPLTVSATSASDGTYSLTLQANNDLTPTGTYYQIDEPGYSFSIVVPQSAGPFIISTIQVNVPPVASPSPSHVTSLVVDTSATVGGLLHTGTLTVDTGPLTLPALSIADSALSANVDLLNAAQTVTGVKHFSAAPIFDAGFSVSAGTVTFATAPTFNAGATFPSSAGVVAMGTGDDVDYLGLNGVAWEMTSQQGTVAAPITTGSGPNVKISRTESILASTMPGGNGAANFGNAALWASAIGGVTNQAQVSALLGTARNASTQTRTANAINIDAAGVQGFGEIAAGGTGNGGGGYFEGRVDSSVSGAGAYGAELRSNNNSGSDGVYNAGAFPGTVGGWVTAGSQTPGRVSSLALGIAPTNSCQWDVGLGFLTIGVSSVKTTTIRDDTSATNSILINGTHTLAFGAKAGAGSISVGHVNSNDALVNSSSLIEAFSLVDADPIIGIMSTANVNLSLRIGNASGSSRYFVAKSASAILAGTAIGDTGIIVATTGKAFHIGGGASPFTRVLTVTNDNKLAHYGVTPVAQPATTGTATGFTAGAGTAVNDASTFTGGTGATAYRISDMVLAMKQLGLLAA